MNALPERGALVWLAFTPQPGRVQAGHRPALVMSPRIYHERSKLAVVCLITDDVGHVVDRQQQPLGRGSIAFLVHPRARHLGDAVRPISSAGTLRPTRSLR